MPFLHFSNRGYAMATAALAIAVLSSASARAEEPSAVEAAEADADEVMTVTAKRRGKGHDAMMATPTPKGRSAVAEWLGQRHAVDGVFYTVDGDDKRTLHIRPRRPTPGLVELGRGNFDIYLVSTCDGLFERYSPSMLRKFSSIGFTTLRHQGKRCAINDHTVQRRERMGQCTKLHPPRKHWRKEGGDLGGDVPVRQVVYSDAYEACRNAVPNLAMHAAGRPALANEQ